jgi:DNA polymerase
VSNPDPQQIAREVRQRLESLGRAGLDRLPIAPVARAQTTSVSRTVEPRPEPAMQPSPPPAAEPPAPVATPKSATPSFVPTTTLFGETGFEAPPLTLEERRAALDILQSEVATCQRCPQLAAARTQTVFGEGNITPRLMFVGEAPGADEDRTGRPFVGRAGMLLTDMITKGMGLEREDVYIANVLKSRPPDNRTPTEEEAAHCLPYLVRQIEILRPEFLCLLGRTAVQALLETSLPMGRLRGKWFRYRGVPTIVTYHPSYLLRTPSAKREVWEDLQMLMGAMGLKVPERRRG